MPDGIIKKTLEEVKNKPGPSVYDYDNQRVPGWLQTCPNHSKNDKEEKHGNIHRIWQTYTSYVLYSQQFEWTLSSGS